MKITRLLRHAVFGLGLAASTAASAAYSQLYVFGDSLSDSGNDFVITGKVGPSPAYYTDGTHTGRFTNGYNYADLLAQSLGLNLKASTLGGTNYAYGGARSEYVRPELGAYGALSFNDQIAQYLGTYGAADPNALYVLWIGSNDMSDALLKAVNTYMSGGDPVPVISAEVSQTVTDIITALVTLETLGGKHFLVGNIPDMALTPTVQSFGSAGISFLANQASVGFNNALLGALPPAANAWQTSGAARAATPACRSARAAPPRAPRAAPIRGTHGGAAPAIGPCAHPGAGRWPAPATETPIATPSCDPPARTSPPARAARARCPFALRWPKSLSMTTAQQSLSMARRSPRTCCAAATSR